MTNIEPLNKFDAAVKEFLSVKKMDMLSDKTISNYKKHLSLFRSYWVEKYGGNITNDPELKDFTSWKIHLSEEGMKNSSINAYLTGVRNFYETVSNEQKCSRAYYDKVPFTKDILLRDKKRPYEKVLTNSEIQKLWMNKPPTNGEYCNRSYNRMWARNYAIIVLLLDSEIRSIELRNIRPRDIDWEYKELVIPKGKGDKRGIVNLSDISLYAIKIYLQSGIRPSSCTEDDYLFGTTAEKKAAGLISGFAWKPMSDAELLSIVNRHVKKVTGRDDITPHALRHAGAKLELNAGTSIEKLQRKLRHSCISTTQIYTDRLEPDRHIKEAKETIKIRNEWAERNKNFYESFSFTH